MMRAVEMYFIIITMLSTTQGLLRSCFYYCKLSPDATSNLRPECDCSTRNQRKTRSINPSNLYMATASSKIDDTGIYYEPAKLNSSHNLLFKEQTLELPNLTSMLISKSGSNGIKYNKRRKTNDTHHSEYDKNYNQHSSQKYKRKDYQSQNVDEEPRDHQLHLYLDIDSVTTSSNKSHLDEIKHMFEKFQTAEKNLSECINLHIYIFSKYIDINSNINTNWNRKDYQDNLTNSQKLTEIQNICDQPDSIIKQSIYEIKQSYPEKKETAVVAQNKEKTIIDNANIDKHVVVQTKLNESYKVESTTTSNQLKITTSSHFANGNANNFTTEKINQMKSDKIVAEHNALLPINNINHRVITDNDLTSTLPFVNKEALQKTTEVIDTTEWFDNEYLRIASETNRSVYPEGEVEITSIITKELSNGTVISVAEDHEEIPNYDFTTNSMSVDERTLSYNKDDYNESTSILDIDTTSPTDKIAESDLIEIQGNLYLLFEKKHIPARFIQQPDGKLNVAIDGYSLCDQMHGKTTSNFMIFLCNCIQLKNCTYPP